MHMIAWLVFDKKRITYPMASGGFRVEVRAELVEVVRGGVLCLHHVLVADDLPLLLQVVVPQELRFVRWEVH